MKTSPTTEPRCEVCTHYSHGSCYAEAFRRARREALAEVIAELATMDCSLSARDAAVDLRQTYASLLESEPREQ